MRHIIDEVSPKIIHGSGKLIENFPKSCSDSQLCGINTSAARPVEPNHTWRSTPISPGAAETKPMSLPAALTSSRAGFAAGGGDPPPEKPPAPPAGIPRPGSECPGRLMSQRIRPVGLTPTGRNGGFAPARPAKRRQPPPPPHGCAEAVERADALSLRPGWTPHPMPETEGGGKELSSDGGGGGTSGDAGASGGGGGSGGGASPRSSAVRIRPYFTISSASSPGTVSRSMSSLTSSSTASRCASSC